MQSKPFPHVIFDGIFPAELFADVNTQWPAPDWPGWVHYGAAGHSKCASDLREPIPEAAGRILHHLASLPWDCWLDLRGMAPDLGLWGAGLHEMRPGECVGPHLDANTHPRLGLKRLATAILYVHECWEDAWGGELVLGQGTDTRQIASAPGRLVGFANSEESVHEVRKVCCPVGVTRRSLTLFFYGGGAHGTIRHRAFFM